MKNINLSQARTAKNDEFYTDIHEIELELEYYSNKFKGKTVFCNCDDPFESSFVKYFLMNFNRLGIKELFASGYRQDGRTSDETFAIHVVNTKNFLKGSSTDLTISNIKDFIESQKDKILIPIYGNYAKDSYGNIIKLETKEIYIDDKSGKKKKRIIQHDLYYNAGDFRSDASIEFLKQADIVVTNPPFSLFREYIGLLTEYKKNFLILGSLNAVVCKELFPLIRNNKMWLGCNNGSKTYIVSDDYAKEFPENVFQNENTFMIKMGNTGWFTNIDHTKRHETLSLNPECTYKGCEERYPKYDNYDAIEVSKISEIPFDYMGIMGVPVSFLNKYCPEQFRIVWQGAGNTRVSAPKEVLDELKYNKHPEDRGGCGVVNGKRVYARIFIQRI